MAPVCIALVFHPLHKSDETQVSLTASHDITASDSLNMIGIEREGNFCMSGILSSERDHLVANIIADLAGAICLE